MEGRVRTSRLAIVLAASLLGIFSAHAQEKPTSDDVVRVSTDLVQTDLTVVDKQGRFVDRLSAEQFELVIDNKPKPIAFFERVRSGLASQPRAETLSSRDASATTRGRIVLFFVDDLHLAPDSLVRTKKALADFINHGIARNDLIAITSSSGQIGFLQQFTDNKEVLQSAVARLNYRGNSKSDMDSPPMSEYMASKIQDGDESAISYYVTEMMKQNCVQVNGEQICMITTQSARLLVIQRARQITLQTTPETTNTLVMLQGLMRTAAQLPGRKLLFLISDGFYLNDRQTASTDRIKRITDAAGRAGVVIYTLDARGLVGEGNDVITDHPADVEGLTAASTIGETSASQDGLNALAVDTGGRAFRNTNRPMAEWVDRILDETSTYYLVAWRPDTEEQKRQKFNNIQISIKGRPDLKVRLRRGYFQTAPLPLLSLNKKREKDPEKLREQDMRLVIDAPVAQLEIRTGLTLSVVQMPGLGTKLVASLEIGREALAFDSFEGKRAADVDIGGIIYDDKGKPKTSFVGRLRVFATPETLDGRNTAAIYNFQAWLPAGLYEVRIGLRDVRNGRVGSAFEWIRVPAIN